MERRVGAIERAVVRSSQPQVPRLDRRAEADVLPAPPLPIRPVYDHDPCRAVTGRLDLVSVEPVVPVPQQQLRAGDGTGPFQVQRHRAGWVGLPKRVAEPGGTVVAGCNAVNQIGPLGPVAPRNRAASRGQRQVDDSVVILFRRRHVLVGHPRRAAPDGGRAVDLVRVFGRRQRHGLIRVPIAGVEYQRAARLHGDIRVPVDPADGHRRGS